MEFIIWIREKKGSAWEQQGDGAMPFFTATRIVKEIGHICPPRRSTRRVIALFVLSHRVPWRSQLCARWRWAATGYA